MAVTCTLLVSTTALGLFLLFIGDSNGLFLVNSEVKVVKETKEQWAVLVAGSNGWDNYRHQADVCHAYQVLHQHGVPDDHIVVMMYDDIAHDMMNPTPGIIINHPNGSDVYHGVPKDYVNASVCPEIFLQVIFFLVETLVPI